MKCITKQCKANALKNSRQCFFHSDKITDEEKKQARIKGGKARQIRVNTEFDIYKLRSINDVLTINERLINDVLQNKISIQILTGIAYNLNLQLKLIEMESIEKRISELENTITNNYEL